MNQLSWLLYLADVSGKLGNLFTIISVISAVAAVIWLIVGLVSAGEAGGDDGFWKGWGKVGFCLIPVFFISFILNAVIPSKDTVYAIAASEMGEKALQSPLAIKASKALEAWLDKQTKGAQ